MHMSPSEADTYKQTRQIMRPVSVVPLVGMPHLIKCNYEMIFFTMATPILKIIYQGLHSNILPLTQSFRQHNSVHYL